MNVCIIDDHVLFREGLVTMLQNKPELSIIGQAGSVIEGIQNVLNLEPDLLLITIELIEFGGLDVMKAIFGKNPDIKIVVMAVSETDERLISALQRGACGYILKTMSISQVMASIRGVQRGELAISRKMTQKILSQISNRRTDFGMNGKPVALTSREFVVLKELSAGKTNQQIAESLFISINTVKIHVHNILKKLGVRSRREASRYAAMILSLQK